MADATGVTNNYATMLGISEGMVALESGWDEDCDPAISESIESVLGRTSWRKRPTNSSTWL